jgi:hypothetical protein
MADDEVPSLVEMGLLQVDPQAFSVPANQIGRLPRAIPVWYKFQRFAIDHLPAGEVSYRLPSLIFGVLTSMLAFFVAARWRGLWFATALAIVMNGSQLFVYLSQLDRFYALPTLLLTAILILIWMPAANVLVYAAIAVLTVLAVLSHNITFVVFVLAFGGSAVLFVLRKIPLQVALKSAVATAVAGAVYVLYLLPIIRGWNSTGNPILGPRPDALVCARIRRDHRGVSDRDHQLESALLHLLLPRRVDALCIRDGAHRATPRIVAERRR